jgi:ribosomal protein L12E/L44/L45/RPP1/RPP2
MTSANPLFGNFFSLEDIIIVKSFQCKIRHCKVTFTTSTCNQGKKKKKKMKKKKKEEDAEEEEEKEETEIRHRINFFYFF